jgi:hypothetical protein
MRGKKLVILLIAAAGLGEFSTPGAAAEGEQFLRRMGLRPLGTIWVTKTEEQLRAQIARVVEASRRYHKAEKHLDGVLKANDAICQRVVELREQIKQLKQAKPKGSAAQLQRRANLVLAQRAVAALQRRCAGPKRLGESGLTRRAAGDLSAARASLTLLLASIRQHVGHLNYGPLSRDPNVAAALATIGENHRLGPAKDYNRELRAVAELENMLGEAALPFYRQGGRLRVSVLVNHRTPATVTLLESGNQTLIPSSLRQAAGIDIPADAPTVVLRIGRRKLQTRKVRIAYLQIGSAVLRDVEALVLPPEGEDLGTQLAPSALSGYQVKLEANRLRLRVQPINDE